MRIPPDAYLPIMKVPAYHVIFSIIAACLVACSPSRIAAADVSITILHTTDIHGHLAGRQTDGSNGHEDDGGLLRCAALVREIRKHEDNVLLLDCGDLIQGTALSFLDRGAAMLDAVKAMQYDALVPGNHEFDWGCDNFRRIYEKSGIPVIVANAGRGDSTTPLLTNAVPFIIREIEGIRVAVIGLTTPHIPNWSRPRLLDGAVFERSIPALRRAMPLVRAENPDIIILAAHQSHNEWGGDNRASEIDAIAREFPDIDILLGGHSHHDVVMRSVAGIPYTQAGCHGLWLGRIDIVADPGARSVKNMKFNLIRADESVAPDGEMTRQFAGALSASDAYLNQPIGIAGCRHPTESAFPGQSQVQALIATAIAGAVNADVVFHRTLSKYELRPGKLTMQNIWGIVPYDNYLGVAHLTVEDLSAILEENAGFLGTREFRGVSGIEYEIDTSGDKPAVRNIRLTGGRELAPGKRVRVAMNSHDMASAGARLPRLREIIDRPESMLDETEIDTREAVITFIKRTSPVCEKAVPGAVVVKDSQQSANPL